MNEMTHLNERIPAFCEANLVPGYLAGVYQGGSVEIVAHGTANVASGAPMRPDTGFLFGSITKVMTSTLLLQQVERGTLELDRPVIGYLPSFRLATPGAADKILVRHLLSHDSGIDADLYFPDASGPEALEVYLDGLGRHCGSLFEPGEYVSYSNGGMIVAGRLLETVTGVRYHDLLRRDVFEPLGMTGAAVSAKEAILRSTAIGHFPSAETGAARPTSMFMLPDTWGPAGATPIGTIRDLIALGRMHLDGGGGVLSAEMTERMHTVAHDMGVPNVPPVGLGLLLIPFGDTTVLSMSGASPGGVAVLAVVPSLDLVFAAFGNAPQALALHNELLLWLVRRQAPVSFPALEPIKIDLRRYAGTYRSQQLRVDVRVVDGGLEEQVTYEPADASQESIFTQFAGGSFAAPPTRYIAVGKDLFAPAALPLETLDGHARQYLISYLGDKDGRPTHRCAGGRMTRRVPE
ncbi:serine hydrolase domain-containing protein [Actinoplanes subtropicus]|uniref:serine hydrolase domain-containing protein n=1 Tax=Actinoplanes subtropicus TaxID=543632 RepID=UPI0004C2C129|nr:serine hydrolase domain-containing protein [Actinoplanes subtropicus]